MNPVAWLNTFIIILLIDSKHYTTSL